MISCQVCGRLFKAINLRFIPWRENIAKYSRCDLTKEELLALIEEAEEAEEETVE